MRRRVGFHIRGAVLRRRIGFPPDPILFFQPNRIETMGSIVVESRSRLPHEEPDSYTVCIDEIRYVTGVRLRWCELDLPEKGRVGRGNDTINIKVDSGRTIQIQIPEGVLSTPDDLRAAISNTLPAGIALNLVPVNGSERLEFTSTIGPLDFQPSSAGRLIGLHPTSSRLPSETVRMQYAPDLSQDPYALMYLDIADRLVTTDQRSNGAFAVVGRGSNQIYDPRRAKLISGAINQFRVTFKRPGGWDFDFAGKDHAFLLDID